MILAALDIGSNSIHLVVVKTADEKSFQVLASAKEVVRLARSVAREGQLSRAAIDRAIECLKRFRRTAEEYGAEEMLTVATSAVREASNRAEFLVRAEKEAGVHVELLSGIEEARLIALAVSVKERSRTRQRQLVIDIGGGSMELAVTRNGEPAALLSLKLGAVRLTELFVKSDPLAKKQLRRLRSELREVIAARAPEILEVGFDLCYGTSGTINTLCAITMRRRLAAAHGSSIRSQVQASLTLDELTALNRELAALSLEERSKIPGLNRDRAEIIVAGGQTLEAAMEVLGVAELAASNWALREGVIIAHRMRRSAAILASSGQLERDPSLSGAFALARHFQSDLNHARRVAFLSQQMFDDLHPLHRLGGEHRRLLIAAAILHDIGYFVSHTNHHKHSAYLIHYGELTGFTDSEVAIIANLARYHRASIPKARHPFFISLPVEDREVVRRLAAILRVADALDRDHKGDVQSARCEIGEKTIRLTAASLREKETTRWRVEERGDLLAEVFDRRLELTIVGVRE